MTDTKKDMDDIKKLIQQFTVEVGHVEGTEEAEELAKSLLDLIDEVGYTIDSIGDSIEEIEDDK